MRRRNNIPGIAIIYGGLLLTAIFAIIFGVIIKPLISFFRNNKSIAIGVLVGICLIVAGTIAFFIVRYVLKKRKEKVTPNLDGNNKYGFTVDKQTPTESSCNQTESAASTTDELTSTYSQPSDTEYPKYASKSSMTDCEKRYWKQLNRLFSEDYIVTHQIPLSSIVRKTIDSYYASELFRTIDFGLFTKEEYHLIALIEINDRSHLERNRIARDYKVKDILKQAGLENKLITLWTDMPNEDEYILKRITEIIE